MDYKEMNQVLADLDQATHTLEDLYIEGEGEVTEETEHLEEQISGLKELLTHDGIDLLGGWLKAKEDRKKSLKAEKDYITRQMSAIDETIEFIKSKINQILVATGQEKVKGSRGYSFATTTGRQGHPAESLCGQGGRGYPGSACPCIHRCVTDCICDQGKPVRGKRG